MRHTLFIFFLVYFGNNNFCQSWQDYSDSSIKYISIDLNKSEEFINISSRLIRNKDKKSTIDYVRYLYRYGVVKLFRSDNVTAEKYLKEAQSRLLEINHTEHFQSAQINFFLAKSQYNQYLEISSMSNFKKAIFDLNKSEITNEYIMQNSTKILSDLYSNLGNCDSILKYSELALDYQIKKKDTSSFHNLGLYDLYNRIIYCSKDSISLEYAKNNLKAANCLKATNYVDSSQYLYKINEASRTFDSLGHQLKARDIFLNADKHITNKQKTYYGDILYNSLGFIYLDLFKYDSAIIYHKKWLNNSINLRGADNKHTILIYPILANDYWQNESYTEAVDCYLKAIEFGLKNDDISKNEISNWYSYLSVLYNSTLLNNNVKSNEYLNLSIYYKGELDVPKTGWDFWEEGDLHLRNEEYDKAKVSYDKVEQKFLQQKDYYGLINLYNQNIGLAFSKRVFSPPDMDYYFGRLKGIQPYVDAKDQPLVDFGYSCYYLLKLKFKKVEEILEKCIPLLNEENEWYYLQSRFLLSRAKSNLGKIDEAFDLMEFCINHFKIKNKLSSTEILTYYESAALLASMNRPEIAMKYITPACVIIDSNDMYQSLIYANLMISKGYALSNQNNLEEAILCFKKAESIYDTFNKYEDYTYAVVLYHKLAAIYILNQDFNKAQFYINKEESILEKYAEKTSHLYSDLNALKGSYFFYQDDYKKSIEFFDLSKKQLIESGIQNFSGNIDLMNLMSLYISGIDPEKAKNEINEVLKDSTKYVSTFIKHKASSFLQKMFFVEGELVNSKNQILNNLETFKRYLITSFRFMSDNEKEKLLSVYRTEFEILNSHLLYFGFDKSFLKKYIDLRSFYNTLLLSNTNKNLKTLINDDQNNLILEKLRSNTQYLNLLFEDQNTSEELIEKLMSQNQELERVLNFEMENKRQKVQSVSYQSIQNNLSLNESYIEIVRVNKQGKKISNPFTDTIYYAAIILEKGKDPELILLDTNNKFENEFITNYNSHLKGSNNNKVDEFSYDFYLSKIIDEVGRDKTIYISPDGVYNNINLNTLYDKSSQSYTISNTDLRIVSGARNFVKNKTDKKENYTFKNATIIGNPIFDLEDVSYSINNEDQSLKRDFKLDDFDKLNRSGIGQLPGTKKEINSIYNLLNQHDWDVDLYEQSNATENQLKNVSSPRILHLATHGFFIPKKNTYNSGFMNLLGSSISIFDSPLRRSGVLLSGAQNTLRGERIGKENGVLTSFEARELDLSNTELVVLSACETGVGEYVSGEGVYGLQRSILEAGSENIIMSLWKVDDEATRILMTTFYLNWIEKGMTIRESLKQAQISLMQNPKYKSPYYWGAFVMIGR